MNPKMLNFLEEISMKWSCNICRAPFQTTESTRGNVRTEENGSRDWVRPRKEVARFSYIPPLMEINSMTAFSRIQGMNDYVVGTIYFPSSGNTHNSVGKDDPPVPTTTESTPELDHIRICPKDDPAPLSLGSGEELTYIH